jgi:hypothetical protein
MFTTQMIAAAPTVVQKPLTSKGDTILSVIQSMNALMRRRTIPSERITAGSVSRMTIGRMTALTNYEYERRHCEHPELRVIADAVEDERGNPDGEQVARPAERKPEHADSLPSRPRCLRFSISQTSVPAWARRVARPGLNDHACRLVRHATAAKKIAAPEKMRSAWAASAKVIA